MKYQSFKNRQIDFNAPVMVYKNLHNGKFSIKQNNLVVGYCDNIILDNVTFKVSEVGRQLVIKTGHKNVHAYIVGYINISNASNLLSSLKITENMQLSYNPYKHNYFYFKSTNGKACLTSFDSLLLDSNNGVYILNSEALQVLLNNQYQLNDNNQ